MNNSLQALLWQQLAARSGLPAQATPQEMLAQLSQQAQTDPTMGLLAQFLTQRQAEASGEQSDSDWPNDGLAGADASGGADVIDITGKQTARAVATPDAGHAVAQLRRKFAVLNQELEELREKNDILAEALGACPLCWGDDRACRLCRGQGRAGATLPDRKLFAQLVAPAMRRLAEQERAPQPLVVEAAAFQSSNHNQHERKAL